MIYEVRAPVPPLDRFVEFLWFYDDFAPGHTREKLLPDGSMELVIDLREHPKKLYDRRHASHATEFRHAWLSGMHRGYIVIDASPGSMMGVHFRPGGAWPFFDAPLSEFTDRVLDLESVLGGRAGLLRERLLAAPLPQQKLELLEQALLHFGRGRMQPSHTLHFALTQLMSLPARLLIRELAARVGVSQKHLIHLFAQQVGLRPKQLVRVLRFQQVIQQLQGARPSAVDWAEVALACGYYDQAHFIHDFHEFSGLTPTAYLRQPYDHPNFLILDPPAPQAPPAAVRA